MYIPPVTAVPHDGQQQACHTHIHSTSHRSTTRWSDSRLVTPMYIPPVTAIQNDGQQQACHTHVHSTSHRSTKRWSTAGLSHPCTFHQSPQYQTMVNSRPVTPMYIPPVTAVPHDGQHQACHTHVHSTSHRSTKRCSKSRPVTPMYIPPVTAVPHDGQTAGLSHPCTFHQSPQYRMMVVVDHFYIALFSALEQTHCARSRLVTPILL